MLHVLKSTVFVFFFFFFWGGGGWELGPLFLSFMDPLLQIVSLWVFVVTKSKSINHISGESVGDSLSRCQWDTTSLMTCNFTLI